MEGILLLISGALFFYGSHFVTRILLQTFWAQCLNEASVYVIACRCVSAIQGVIASTAGAIIAASCQDIMKDVHWLTNAYVFFGMPYFVYDLWAMYAYNIRVYDKTYRDLSSLKRVRTYVARNIVMVLHHVLLPSILLPIILILRENRGDFFFGMFFMIETVIPLISAREILIQLNMKHTRLYFYTSLVMVLVFFFCRLMIFPYLYYAYAQYAEISFIDVPFHIPIKCNLSCILLLAPQIYWFGLMVRGLFRVFSKLGKSDSAFGNSNSHLEKEQ